MGKKNVTAFRLRTAALVESKAALSALPEGKLLINTINAYSYNTALRDPLFAAALSGGGALIPDGESIVRACRWIGARSRPKERIAGWDLFVMEMERLNARGGTCLFLGSSEDVLSLIRSRASSVYPHIRVVTYSPPYKSVFSESDSRAMVSAINDSHPDLVWIGMTAPKQEKWVYSHWAELDIRCHVGTIGAVFNFFAGTEKRAPVWWQRHGIEWLYRLVHDPRRLWKRYVVGNVVFLYNIITKG